MVGHLEVYRVHQGSAAVPRLSHVWHVKELPQDFALLCMFPQNNMFVLQGFYLSQVRKDETSSKFHFDQPSHVMRQNVKPAM